MKILFATSEIFPFSKTGGLADMASFLPKSLTKLGYEMIVITPYYKEIAKYHDEMEYVGYKEIKIGNEQETVHYYKILKDNIEIIFVQNRYAFERDAFYGYDDDALRFMLFSCATLEYVDLLDTPPQIIHCNDWQSATIPYLLDEHYRKIDIYKYIHTLLTIHNLEHQGIFRLDKAKYFNRPFDYTYVHFDTINYLKTGIERATKINTVSPNYRKEIMTSEYGFSLDGALMKRSNDLIGILNGIDHDVFDPKTDSAIKTNYNVSNFSENKKVNKQDILATFKIESNDDAPLLAYIGRMAHQKGIYLMEETLERVINETNINLVVLGTGEDKYEHYFQYLEDKYPNRVGYYRGYNEKMAHEIYAASDIFLMPSLFEPCGLGQMIAMRYGSIPVVRETGGLKDTVEPYNKITNTGTGFSFFDENANVFKNVLMDAINLYNNDKVKWNQLIKRAMKVDFGLERMALEYSNLYKEIVEG